MKQKYICAIIDDEITSLEATTAIIENFFPNIVIAKTYQNSLEALKDIPNLYCDFILIDIAMPGLNGLDFVRALPENGKPEIVYLTGYDKYAIDAIKLNAIDYIVKPLTPLHLKDILEKIDSHESSSIKQPSPLGILVVNRVDKALVLELDKINYFMASGPYSHIFLSDNSVIVATKTLKYFNSQLFEKGFLRPHRTYLFNAKNITEIKKESDASGIVYFKKGNPLKITLDCKNNLINMLSEV